MMRSNTAALALVLMAVPCAAGRAGSSEQSAARSVIERQIEAFRRDDSAVAYSLAAPWLQQVFPTEEAFMALVRQGYRPVYRPRRYEFQDTVETRAGLNQTVEIQDENGTDWVATYLLERQADGSWRIAACQLAKAPGERI